MWACTLSMYRKNVHWPIPEKKKNKGVEDIRSKQNKASALETPQNCITSLRDFKA